MIILFKLYSSPQKRFHLTALAAAAEENIEVSAVAKEVQDRLKVQHFELFQYKIHNESFILYQC